MTDDIVTRLRDADDLIRTYIIDNDYLLGLIAESADEIERLREKIQTVNLEWRDLIDQTQEKAFAEIERLRALTDQLAEALELQCQFHRIPVTTEAYYTQHAKWALEAHKEMRNHPQTEKHNPSQENNGWSIRVCSNIEQDWINND